MSAASRPHPPSGRQTTVDRFVWPVVIVLLFAAALVIAVAWRQALAVTADREQLERSAARATADFAESILVLRVEDYRQFVTSQQKVIDRGDEARLAIAVRDVFLADAPSRVRAAAVAAPDGTLMITGERNGSDLSDPMVVRELTATARAAVQSGRDQVSGVIDLGESQGYAHAIPLAADEFGVLIVLEDVELSALGTYVELQQSEDLPDIALVDDRGGLLAGSRIGGEEIAERTIPGTGWTARAQAPEPEGLLPIWAYPALLCAFVLLGAFYWLQEGTRRTLQSESSERAEQVQRLYEFVSHLLHARGARDQAERLARAAIDLVHADGARVRIAREGGRAGIAVGATDGAARQYRVAVTGPHRPVGELVCYRDTPFTAQERSIVRTMTTLAGAAMHTNVVLERERATAEELQRIDELRTNLLSTVAHELRSPLTAVKGVLGLLGMQQDLSDKQREYVELAEQRTDALVALIQDLFDCSLLENGQLDIKPERRQATELIDHALGALSASRGDELFISATPNLMVTVDPIRFDQIVNNLVTNAFRHGKPPVDVELRPYAEGACVIVSDNGAGIPESERDAIFSKFYQSDSGHARLVEGAGLGLALVHGLVRLHGGRIEVDAAKVDGRGARFRVYLPDVTPESVELGEPYPPDDEFGIAQLRSIG
jgi:signal transduction histidine kinase